MFERAGVAMSARCTVLAACASPTTPVPSPTIGSTATQTPSASAGSLTPTEFLPRFLMNRIVARRDMLFAAC